MECVVEMDNDNPFDEGFPPTAPSLVGSEGEEEEEEEDDDVEEDGDSGEENEGEEGGEDRSVVVFEGVMDPLDFVEGNADDVQLYQLFERIEYEALEKKKRKSVEFHDQGHGLVKKPRQTIGATLEEVAEVMNLGCRRKQKKYFHGCNNVPSPVFPSSADVLMFGLSGSLDKKRGRRKGSRNNLSPEITRKLGDANLHYAHGHYEAAISVLKEVVRLAPNLPDPYHILGLAYDKKSDIKKATDFYMFAAYLSPKAKAASLWKRLVTSSIEHGNTGQAWYCLSRAITADPSDVTLRYHRASLFLEAGDSLKAAETYDQIVRISHNNVEALKKATMLYNQCGRYENSITMLEDYLKDHPDADLAVVDLLASSYMKQNEYTKALQHIESAERVYGTGEFPLHLTIGKGICHVHLADMDKAQICFRLLEKGVTEQQTDLIIAVANTFAELQQFESALKYYLMLEGCPLYNGLVCLKIANCYSALKEAASAIPFFYKALGAHEDDIDIRLTLASLLFEENREDEAIKLLSPPLNSGLSKDGETDNSEQWWCTVKVKLKLSQFYKSRGMLEAFVEVIYPLVHESLEIDSMHQKVKRRKSLSRSELLERVKVLGDHQPDSVFGHFRRPALKNEILKANRAKKKLLEKRALANEDKTSAAMDVGLEWESDDSEDEIPQQPLKAPPWPDFFKDEENYNLISDLCRALASLRRYSEALELITLSLKITYKTLPTEKKEKFRSLGAEIATNITDPSDGFDYVRYLVQQRPQCKAAWNCYYKLVLRLENRLSKHNKFLHHMRAVHKDLVPPMIISGNQFTSISQHQVAAREYLEAYKQMPASPLINLCAGTALINLALGHRLQNKHQCVAQGLAFLYNNLRICENNQEALYNLGRACHHVGLVSLAASYYEKVLAIRQEDLPMPEIMKMEKDATSDPKPGDSLYFTLSRLGEFDDVKPDDPYNRMTSYWGDKSNYGYAVAQLQPPKESENLRMAEYLGDRLYRLVSGVDDDVHKTFFLATVCDGSVVNAALEKEQLQRNKFKKEKVSLLESRNKERTHVDNYDYCVDEDNDDDVDFWYGCMIRRHRREKGRARVSRTRKSFQPKV
ncbi:hypothetical protein KSS87_016470 [Heliosperma pusillum]|nr:hypothetical protein KSS87_016470 [Heliosperma pusillum]